MSLDAEIAAAALAADRAKQRLRDLRTKKAANVADDMKIARVIRRKGCRHRGIREFKVSEHEWRCTECGRIGAFDPSTLTGRDEVFDTSKEMLTCALKR